MREAVKGRGLGKPLHVKARVESEKSAVEGKGEKI